MSYLEFRVEEVKPVPQILVKHQDGTEEYMDDPRAKNIWLERKVLINAECIQSVEETYTLNYSKTIKSRSRLITKDNKTYYIKMSYEKAKNLIDNKSECGFKYANKL
jgi:hypothetical protein